MVADERERRNMVLEQFEIRIRMLLMLILWLKLNALKCVALWSAKSVLQWTSQKKRAHTPIIKLKVEFDCGYGFSTQNLKRIVWNEPRKRYKNTHTQRVRENKFHIRDYASYSRLKWIAECDFFPSLFVVQRIVVNSNSNLLV